MGYVVMYRTGGTENFKWHKMLELFTNRWDAIRWSNNIGRMGYATIVRPAPSIEAAVLPVSYYVELNEF